MAGAARHGGGDHPLPRFTEVQGRAARERQQGGHVARIERQGHAVEHGPTPIELDTLRMIGHQVDQAALLHHDPLGQAGAAGGVDDLGQHGRIPRDGGDLGWQDIAGQRLQRQSMQIVVAGIGAGQCLGEPFVLLPPQHQVDGGVTQDMSQSLGGIGRIERHIGRPRLPAGEQRDDEGEIPLGLDADGGARGHPLHQQPVGQLVGPGLQLAITQGALAVAHRQGSGVSRRLALELAEQGVAALVVHRQAGELGGQCGPVHPRLQWQLPDVGVGGRHHGAHQVQQAIGVGLDGLSLEQGGGEQPVHPDGIHQLGHLDRDVGLGGQHRRGLLHQLAAGDEIVEVHLGLIDQHDLEDGVDGGGAIGADGLGQRLEAVELVIEGRQILLPALLQIVDKAGLAAELSAQHQGIDEKAHQRLDLVALAIGERGADHHLLLAALAHHQQGKQGVQTDEVGGVVALAQPLEAVPQRVVYGGEDQLAAAGLMGRAGLVQRQAVHLGAAAEAVHPERLELGVVIQKARRVEPAGIVDIGERQLGQIQRLAVLMGEEGTLEIGEHVLDRPAVGDDVVLGDQQHVLAAAEADQVHPAEIPLGQGEGAPDLLAHPAGHIGLALGNGLCAHVLDMQLEGGVGQDLLRPPARLVLDEAGAHAGVAGKQVVEGKLQRRRVQLPLNAKIDRHVVEVGGLLVLLDKPEPALGRGERPLQGPLGGDRRLEGGTGRQAAHQLILVGLDGGADGRRHRLLARLGDELALVVQRQLDALPFQLFQQQNHIVHLYLRQPAWRDGKKNRPAPSHSGRA
ncbi:hypothetical protein D3C84_249600 [compost metagenome]